MFPTHLIFSEKIQFGNVLLNIFLLPNRTDLVNEKNQQTNEWAAAERESVSEWGKEMEKEPTNNKRKKEKKRYEEKGDGMTAMGMEKGNRMKKKKR